MPASDGNYVLKRWNKNLDGRWKTNTNDAISAAKKELGTSLVCRNNQWSLSAMVVSFSKLQQSPLRAELLIILLT